MRDCKHVSSEACCLVRVGVGGSDSNHKADPSFHAITNVPRILDTSTVLMMGIHKRVNEAHHHDPILEASQEHLGDQVMEKMASPWKHSSLSPNKNKHIVQERAFVVMGERASGIRTSNSTRLFSVKSLCRTQPVAEDAQKTNGESRTGSTRPKFHVVQYVRISMTTDWSQNFGGPQGDRSSNILPM